MNKYFKSFLMAISMFTIIPLPRYEWDDEGGKNILKFYPLIGLIIGLIWYGVFKLFNLSFCLLAIITFMLSPFPFLFFYVFEKRSRFSTYWYFDHITNYWKIKIHIYYYFIVWPMISRTIIIFFNYTYII